MTLTLVSFPPLWVWVELINITPATILCYMAKDRLCWVVLHNLLTSSGDPFKSIAFFSQWSQRKESMRPAWKKANCCVVISSWREVSSRCWQQPPDDSQRKHRSQSYKLTESKSAKTLNVLRSGFFSQSLKKWAQPGSHLDFSRPWAGNPTTLCWDLWPTELWAHKRD